MTASVDRARRVRWAPTDQHLPTMASAIWDRTVPVLPPAVISGRTTWECVQEDCDGIHHYYVASCEL